MAHMLAVESELVTADVVEVNEFPIMAQQYQVYAVPKTVINDQVQFEGARPEPVFIGAIEMVTRKDEDDGADST
jgi:predicted DsbA family dithiol-disulfide isomerase